MAGTLSTDFRDGCRTQLLTCHVVGYVGEVKRGLGYTRAGGLQLQVRREGNVVESNSLASLGGVGCRIPGETYIDVAHSCIFMLGLCVCEGTRSPSASTRSVESTSGKHWGEQLF